MIGDVALAHDIGGLLAAGRLGLKLTIVLLDNGGGGIFDFLPVSQSRRAASIYTRHIATPTGLDFARAAALYGLSHERVADVHGFRAALERALVARSLEHHRSPWRARGERGAACAHVGRRVEGDQPVSRGSNAASLTSVSASSRGACESRTMPFPA